MIVSLQMHGPAQLIYKACEIHALESSIQVRSKQGKKHSIILYAPGSSRVGPAA